MKVNEWRISIAEWRRLPENERKLFDYVSDQSGCYFRRMKVFNKDDVQDQTDDFERLINQKEG